MTFEEFQVGALNLGCSLNIDKYGTYRFDIDGVGIQYSGDRYVPFGTALCRYWSDELICEHMRAAVVSCGSADMALDYLELLESFERINVDTYTNER